jgi:two-component system sensor histidine kinase DesK
MTSVTGTVGGLRLARGYLRAQLVFTAVVYAGVPALTVLDDRWGRPPASPASLLLVAIVGGVAATHVVLQRPGGSAGAPGRLVAVAALAASVAGLVAVGRAAPELGLVWFLVPGLALSTVLATLGWRRTDVLAAGAAVVAAVALAVALDFPLPAGGWVRPALLLAALAMPLLTDLGTVALIRLLDRLEEANRLADELATARERARIAAELHDVQGHSLHAIALHAELTERLVATDPQAAAGHARTVRTLAADALAETRSLVRGYRGADLGGELRNAAGLLRAAGADATVGGDPAAVPPDHAALLGPVVREAATNVLRHSDPARVGFVVRRAGDRTELEVRNDGVPSTPDGAAHDPDGGTGLSGLTERITAGGGTLEAGPDGDDGWRLRVVLVSGTGEAER